MKNEFLNKELLIEKMLEKEPELTYEEAKKNIEIEEKKFFEYETKKKIDREFFKFASKVSEQVKVDEKFACILYDTYTEIMEELEFEKYYNNDNKINEEQQIPLYYEGKKYFLTFTPYTDNVYIVAFYSFFNGSSFIHIKI